eukprot:1958024-Rhodomonas_salina.4
MYITIILYKYKVPTSTRYYSTKLQTSPRSTRLRKERRGMPPKKGVSSAICLLAWHEMNSADTAYCAARGVLCLDAQLGKAWKVQAEFSGSGHMRGDALLCTCTSQLDSYTLVYSFAHNSPDGVSSGGGGGGGNGQTCRFWKGTPNSCREGQKCSELNWRGGDRFIHPGGGRPQDGGASGGGNNVRLPYAIREPLAAAN